MEDGVDGASDGSTDRDKDQTGGGDAKSAVNDGSCKAWDLQCLFLFDFFLRHWRLFNGLYNCFLGRCLLLSYLSFFLSGSLFLRFFFFSLLLCTLFLSCLFCGLLHNFTKTVVIRRQSFSSDLNLDADVSPFECASIVEFSLHVVMEGVVEDGIGRYADQRATVVDLVVVGVPSSGDRAGREQADVLERLVIKGSNLFVVVMNSSELFELGFIVVLKVKSEIFTIFCGELLKLVGVHDLGCTGAQGHSRPNNRSVSGSLHVKRLDISGPITVSFCLRLIVAVPADTRAHSIETIISALAILR